MTKKTRQQVHDKFGGRCAYCGCELTKGWHVDHVLPINRVLKRSDKGLYTDSECEHPERNTEDNYYPSCASCNMMKTNAPIEHFRGVIAAFMQSLNKYSPQYRFAKRYGLIEETAKPVVFYFETYKTEQQ